MTLAGGCLCGKLRYTIAGEPTAVGKCYCPDCRKESGTGHMTFISFPAKAITLDGDVSSYTRAGGSGADVVRIFCPSCGTTVVGYPKALGDVGAVRAGTLDDPADLAPTFAVYGSRAPGWDRPPADIRVFATMPGG